MSACIILTATQSTLRASLFLTQIYHFFKFCFYVLKLPALKVNFMILSFLMLFLIFIIVFAQSWHFMLAYGTTTFCALIFLAEEKVHRMSLWNDDIVGTERASFNVFIRSNRLHCNVKHVNLKLDIIQLSFKRHIFHRLLAHHTFDRNVNFRIRENFINKLWGTLMANVMTLMAYNTNMIIFQSA